MNLRAKIARIWPDGQITVIIKSASVIDHVTLLKTTTTSSKRSGKANRAAPLSGSGWSSRLDSADRSSSTRRTASAFVGIDAVSIDPPL